MTINGFKGRNLPQPFPEDSVLKQRPSKTRKFLFPLVINQMGNLKRNVYSIVSMTHFKIYTPRGNTYNNSYKVKFVLIFYLKNNKSIIMV